MASFLARRLGVMLLTMLCLTLIVFYLVNLEPNLRKLAISQTEMHASDEQLAGWLTKNGYRRPFFVRYATWLGVWPKEPAHDPATGAAISRFSWCGEPTTPRLSGVLQGDFGCSTKFKVKVVDKLGPALEATGILMFWVMALMIPVALAIGIVSGMREGSRADRGLSVIAIATTSTPEYVTGVVLSIIFATWLGWLNGSAASATEGHLSFYNFTLPVVTVALYGMGQVARMTRASMVEVMSAQYIRTARLKGLTFGAIVLKHALRNALIPVITLGAIEFGRLLSGAVLTEQIFAIPGFGKLLVDGVFNRDYAVVQGVVLVSAVLYVFLNLVGDVLYFLVNPRLRSDV
jgi:peptide/nickel transport system permease protein